MGVDEQLHAVAARTPKFGYLLVHEPRLVAHGAAAKSIGFADPNTSMIKSRRFGEALTDAALRDPDLQDGDNPRSSEVIAQEIDEDWQAGFESSRPSPRPSSLRRLSERAT